MTGRIRPKPDDIPGTFSVVLVKPTKRKDRAHRGRKGKQSRVDRAERMKEALELRRRGLSWREVATQLGVNVSTAYEWGMEAIADIPRESADAVRKIESERIDAIIRANWNEMKLGNTQAGTLVLKAIERRARLLGLDQVSPEQGAAIDAIMFALVSRLPQMTLAEKEAELAELTDILAADARPDDAEPVAIARADQDEPARS